MRLYSFFDQGRLFSRLAISFLAVFSVRIAADAQTPESKGNWVTRGTHLPAQIAPESKVPASPTGTARVVKESKVPASQTGTAQVVPESKVPASPTSTSIVFPEGALPDTPATSPIAIQDMEPASEAQVPQPGLYAPVSKAEANYFRPGVGVRPIADYAPPGFIARDPQPGIGAALYRPLPAPTPEQIPTELEMEKFVTRGIFPRTYLIPGTNTSFRWYGFVRADGIFDFDPIAATDDFVTSSIPIPQGRGQNASINPRYSRLGWDTYTPTDICDWTVYTRIEVDFFNGNRSGAFGSFPLRLRYAYADFGPFRIGQAPSVFMDYDVFPNVLDYEGPPGMVLVRQPIARVTLPVYDNCHVAVALEQPYSDILWEEDGDFVVNPGSGIVTTAGAPRNVQDIPDLTGHFRYDSPFGHFQIAGIVRKLTFQPAEGEDLNRLGSGVNLTGSFRPWAWWAQSNPQRKDSPCPYERSRFLGQYAVGRGINRYIQDVNGFGLDAAFIEDGAGFRALSASGWFGCYEHWWTNKWISNFCYGETFTSLPATLPGDTYHGARYAAINLIWLPTSRMGVGIEYLWGERENQDGQSGFARRIQTAFQFSF